MSQTKPICCGREKRTKGKEGWWEKKGEVYGYTGCSGGRNGAHKVGECSVRIRREQICVFGEDLFLQRGQTSYGRLSGV